jgi:selenocysteine lyase/cysteine desulfurase
MSMGSKPLVPRDAFALEPGVTYLDSGYSHPISRGARTAVDAYLDFRMGGKIHGGYDTLGIRNQVHERFAKLIGAQADEVALVPSTMAGENAVLAGLKLTGGRGRIVTDGLNFVGSLYLYDQLRARGVEVVVVPPRDGAIHLEDLEAALTVPTDLVAVSLVSNYNGFRHDLDAVCSLAHAHGALVYADIIQGVGAVPFDVKTSGVDYCATATYKWLMGDFGVGFIYRSAAGRERLDLPAFGYRQLAESTAYPDRDPPLTWTRRDDATGDFALGTVALGVVSQLHHSLQWLLDLDVANLAAHRATLLDRLRDGLEAKGVRILTPRQNLPSPMFAFAPDDLPAAAKRVEQAGIFLSAYGDRLRLGPSMFNDFADIDRLLDAI